LLFIVICDKIDRKGMTWIMQITYLAHSGFLLEWDACYWLFDYYHGMLPKLDPDKKLFVFCSHSHRDHFNPEIFSMVREHPTKEYIFSKELKRACEREKQKAREYEFPEIHYVASGTDYRSFDGAGSCIRVHAMLSTDCGCGFYLEYNGKSIYHAGDLHWWIWPGEPEMENRNMTGRYKKEMEYLSGKTLDLAFSPLDPRQEEWYRKGADYLLRIACIRYFFPMHFWDDYSTIRKYIDGNNEIPAHTTVMMVEKEGQNWEVCL